ncbi:site-specific integrase [Microbacterium sp. NPDC079995]|uniref:tyrosine-type recombinase/integrase n=1 Tax=unclassified Microbacterium TaxID=2609290 RepID=UPI00344D563D
MQRQASELVHRQFAETKDATLGELLDAWVQRSQRVCRPQTARTYAGTAKWLKEECGALSVRSFDLRQAKNLLQRVSETRRGGEAAAQQAKVALTGALAQAIDRDLIDRNFIRDIERERPQAAPPTYLTLEQLEILRAVVLEREERTRPNAGASAGLLRWGIEACVGSGLRIGEVLALRRVDVDMDTRWLTVRATLVDGDEDGGWKNTRQTRLKVLGQARRQRASRFAIAALREASAAGKDPDPLAPILQSRNGTFVAARNFRRQLREVRLHPGLVRALARTELTPDDLTPHILRRTAATLSAIETGDLSRASNLLGHTDVNTTKRHYVGVAWRQVDESDVLDTIFGRGTDVDW